LFEDPEVRDNPVLPGTNAFGDPNTEYKYNDHYPEVHDIMRELRSVLDTFPGADRPVLIGETAGPDVKSISAMYGPNLDEIQLPMNFFIAYVNKRSATLKDGPCIFSAITIRFATMCVMATVCITMPLPNLWLPCS
jgi:alpha-glucosidase